MSISESIKQNKGKSRTNKPKPNNDKVKKEKFPYTKEEYKNRIVFATLLKYFTSKSTFTVFVKQYFSDKTQISCAAELMTKEEIIKQKHWLMLYKVGYANQSYECVYVNLVRKYRCTAEEYFEKTKNKSRKEIEDEWEGCEDW